MNSFPGSVTDPDEVCCRLRSHPFFFFCVCLFTGLKDPRYKLIHYSKDALSIRLTNVTTQDEGQYTCFHYSVPLRTKKVNVTVLGKSLGIWLSVYDNNLQRWEG